jgi:hypothetical protein
MTAFAWSRLLTCLFLLLPVSKIPPMVGSFRIISIESVVTFSEANSMTDNDPLDSGWDTLAEEFGLADQTPKGAPTPKSEAAPKLAKKPAAKPPVEFDEGDDSFGAGIDDTSSPNPTVAMFDPGPDHIEHDLEEDDAIGEAAEELPDPEEEGEVGEAGESVEATEEGGQKKKRRRRRRRKKGSGSSDATAEGKKVEEADDSEEDEASADIDGDDDEPTSALDEVLVEEGPRPEWKVMTWNELVGKLYRPS